ncbi:MAG: hypothetical protein BWY74_04171 [Firmicutes bacterium ADurb.Bin419]|nr:MAG: hypothetical protein BWY74_04171 [Firmicutes bacterium ADurb.Bin419]
MSSSGMDSTSETLSTISPISMSSASITIIQVLSLYSLNPLLNLSLTSIMGIIFPLRFIIPRIYSGSSGTSVIGCTPIISVTYLISIP